jgi:type IX secretion system substrate protein
MRKLVFIILLYSPFCIISQEYQPFDFDNGIWICRQGYYGEAPEDYIAQFYTSGDTIINEIQYKKIFQYRIDANDGPDYGSVINDRYFGGIRNNESKQVEIVYYYRIEPEIIYDFNLSLGDTIKVGYSSEDYNWKPLIVRTIDSILYCGEYHKRYNLNDSIPVPQALIEGIGFTNGFINPIFFQFEQETSLKCYTEKGNENCDDCSLLLSERPIQVDSEVSIFPNPNNGILSLISKNGLTKISIYNLEGQKVHQNYNIPSGSFDIHLNIENGIYLLRGLNHQGHIVTKKIIKTE